MSTVLILDDYVNHWKTHYPQLIPKVDESKEVTPVMWSSARSLITQVNLFLKRLPPDFVTSITSGWRPFLVNQLVPNAAPKSKHVLMQAVDLADPEGILDEFCMDAPQILTDLRLWFEHPASTKGWCHLQNMPYGSYKSGKPRWFYP